MPKRKLPNWSLASLIVVLVLCSIPSRAATYRVLYGFSGGSEGGGLYSGVVIDGQGSLYGGTIGGGGGGGTIYEVRHNSDGTWTKSIIRNLDFQNDGGEPNGGMVFDAEGNLYSTTSNGGPQGFGTVFQLVPNPSGEWVLNLALDTGSHTGLAIDPAGNLFGLGAGAFELSPDPDGWTYQQIYGFQKEHDPGTFYSPMILDDAGNLYGASVGGGNGPPKCPGSGSCGTVFKLHPNPDGTWTEHLLHKFAAWDDDGRYATGGVTRDAAGNLYGTTLEGGSHRNGGRCRVGCGTIYKLARQPDGRWREDILYNFPKDHDGLFPSAAPTLDAAGNLYGTTEEGGDPVCTCGVIYKLTHNPDDTCTYTVLHRFHGTDGRDPAAPMVMDKKGNLYGTTISGGPGGKGVVFKVTP